jgi:hypothetical protein
MRKTNEATIFHNNRIPPRLRSCCGADSPQRGEYRALSGYQQKCYRKADLLRDGSNVLLILAASQPIWNSNITKNPIPNQGNRNEI